jgi:acetoin utilization deacetylase AcuC-like enzyme
VTPVIVAGPIGDAQHDGGASHPERPARLRAVADALRTLSLNGAVQHPPLREATVEELARVHDPVYLAELEAFCRRGGGAIDPDTYARGDSWAAARLAAGAGLVALEELERRGEGAAFVAVRPPGHHATRDRAMGFCLVNNIAVAAASRTERGERVAIIDWDVHHGNGTQDIFWNDPDVLYVSTHQHPLYPGTGRSAEVGGPDAIGLTMNVPVPPGATGDVVRAALDEVARPVVEHFRPEWVLVSCGFDGHRDDPLAELALSSGDFAELTRLVREFAPADGRLALFLEGGYDLGALASSVHATLGALAGAGVGGEAPTRGGPGLGEVRAAGAVRRAALDRAYEGAGP